MLECPRQGVACTELDGDLPHALCSQAVVQRTVPTLGLGYQGRAGSSPTDLHTSPLRVSRGGGRAMGESLVGGAAS